MGLKINTQKIFKTTWIFEETIWHDFLSSKTKLKKYTNKLC